MSRRLRRPPLAVLILAAVPAVVALSGPAPGRTREEGPARQGAPPKPATGKAAAPAPTRNIGGPGDYGLREKLIGVFGRDPDIRRADLSVILVNGGVVLSGHVPNWSIKRRALVTASVIRGVVNVTDQIEIPRGTVSDAQLAKAVSGLLHDLRDVINLRDPRVGVTDSVVTLSGTVKDFAARVRAEESAGTVLGVTRIVNRLQPANAPGGHDDASIQKALAGYLGDYREFPYGGNLQVQVKDGRALLQGIVPFYLARQQAQTMAALVGGVRAVDNRIHVDPSLQFAPLHVTEIP